MRASRGKATSTPNQASVSCQPAPKGSPWARYSARNWIHSHEKYHKDARVIEENAANPRMRSPTANAAAPAATCCHERPSARGACGSLVVYDALRTPI